MDPIEIQDWKRTWTLMRADPNMREIMAEANGKLTLASADASTSSSAPKAAVFSAQPFSSWRLTHQGTQTPNLATAGLEALPEYDIENRDHEKHYCNALDLHLIPYLTSNPSLQRLEGIIQVRCPWPRNTPSDHYVDTLVKLYQFENGVNLQERTATLLVLWAPDSPRLPANPDGSVLGYS